MIKCCYKSLLLVSALFIPIADSLAMNEFHSQTEYQLHPLPQNQQQLTFVIDRAAQGLDDGIYVIDLTRWPQQVTSWCKGGALHALPFCGGTKGELQKPPIEKVVYFHNHKMQVKKITENQDGKLLRNHQVHYQPEHPRLKAKLQSTNAVGARLAKTSIIDKAPITLVSLESLLLNRWLQNPAFTQDDNLHWFEPKRSKRMRLKSSRNPNTWNVEHYNPRSGKRIAMFTITFNDAGLPLHVRPVSGKWILKLTENHNGQEGKHDL